MQTNTCGQGTGRARRINPRAFTAGAGLLLGVVLGCQPDATVSPVAPTSPAHNVSSDGTWMVNSLADPGDGECTNNECTLREAIAAAQAGDRITFKSNLDGTIALTAGALNIDQTLTIEARDPRQVTINGQGASSVFQIGIGGNDLLVTLSGLTIVGGQDFDGGGIDILSDGTLNLIGSVVAGNSANYGGGINAGNGSLVRVVGSTIASNTATTGAGGGIYSRGDLTVTRSTISGNTAGLEGGGIAVDCNFGDCTSVIIQSSTITQNSAPTGGGLHWFGADETRVSNSIIAGNRLFASLIGATADCSALGLVGLGYNLTSAGTGCDFTAPTDIIMPFADQVFTSVLQLLLADNGGAIPTHALIERGRAVDVGSCPGENGDQRGFPRPYDDLRMPNVLDACDIGAFEWNPPGAKKVPKP